VVMWTNSESIQAPPFAPSIFSHPHSTCPTLRHSPEGCFFSLEALEAELKADETIAIVKMPGWLIAEGIEATHAGDPIPGWMQYDQGVRQDFSTSPPKVTHVGGELLDRERIYQVATKIGDLTNGQSPPLTEYFLENPDSLPPKGAYLNVQSELMSYFARNLWVRIYGPTLLAPFVIVSHSHCCPNLLNSENSGTPRRK
jgi:hypothetical protein